MAYINDILIFSRTIEEYTTHVRAVLDRLRERRLYVKLSKYEFSVPEVLFLGYRVGAVGVSMDLSRVNAIMKWPVPTLYREI